MEVEGCRRKDPVKAARQGKEGEIMHKKRFLTVMAIFMLSAGLVLFGVAVGERQMGEKKAERIVEKFWEELETSMASWQQTEESRDLAGDSSEMVGKEETWEEEETEMNGEPEEEGESQNPVFEEGAIGIIEIESIDLTYPIFEGTGEKNLTRGIGHLSETAGIGERGNCVLCGHNGNRRGIFFTHLNKACVGDLVRITDKNGSIHEYEIVNMRVVGPRENSIKDTDGTEKLTLFTCAVRGTMRLVCDCMPKEQVN